MMGIGPRPDRETNRGAVSRCCSRHHVAGGGCETGRRCSACSPGSTGRSVTDPRRGLHLDEALAIAPGYSMARLLEVDDAWHPAGWAFEHPTSPPVRVRSRASRRSVIAQRPAEPPYNPA
jgi:hypothetical protein